MSIFSRFEQHVPLFCSKKSSFEIHTYIWREESSYSSCPLCFDLSVSFHLIIPLTWGPAIASSFEIRYEAVR